MLFRILVFFWVQRTELPRNGFFTSYWEFTTQLNFSMHGKLYFASCPKLWVLELLLVSPVLPLLGFRKELLDPMHGDFSKSSGIVLYQLLLILGVFLCFAPKRFRSRIGGQQTGCISAMKDRKTSKRLLKTSSVVLSEKCLVILLRPTQAENKPSKNRRKFHTYQLAWTCPTCEETVSSFVCSRSTQPKTEIPKNMELGHKPACDRANVTTRHSTQIWHLYMPPNICPNHENWSLKRSQKRGTLKSLLLRGVSFVLLKIRKHLYTAVSSITIYKIII